MELDRMIGYRESSDSATFSNQFKAARRSSVPLIGVTTADPAATMASIMEANIQLFEKDFHGRQNQQSPVLLWDVARGCVAVNVTAEPIVRTLLDGGESTALSNPVDMLIKALKLPTWSVLLFSNAQRFINDPQVLQAIWNLRDAFKQNIRTLVMLCPTIVLPPELAPDVLMLDEPLPGTEKLGSIINETYEAAGLSKPTTEVVSHGVDAISGLAAFPAEQVCAMSISKNGLAMDWLWERKRQQIEQTPGLSVWRGGEKFSDIGGCDNVKRFVTRVINGENRPRAIVFQDEIEKSLAGAAGDLSGTTQELLGSQLTFMQDKNATGLLFIGHPGAAKSAIAKAAGNEAGIPTIQFDLGGMKGSLLGESNANMRTSLKVVEAVSQGRALFIATCNDIKSLPPELRRRFSFGTFFFDLPTAKERDLIWNIYFRKFNLKDKDRPSDIGWTGAEIKNCCDIAWRLKTTLKDAASYIVPLVTSAKERIENLRREADSRFISASEPGPYKAPEGIEELGGVTVVAIGTVPKRRINTEKGGSN